MFLFHYWSFWNFNWYLCSELGIVPLNGPLKMSIINTSILGGLMTYVYPKRIIIKEKNIIIKDRKLKIVDFICHQIPLIRLYFLNKISNICGLYSIIPVSTWILYLHLLKINKNSIYKIKFHHLMYASSIISSLIGISYHRPSLLYKLYI
jgi:hypothetical protein